jgi:nicotinamide-nucleotide amidase
LGVLGETLANYNLTSEQVALEMARGALNNSEANLAISNTGVADDSDPDISAGTQCYAWIFLNASATRRELAKTQVFAGEHNEMREVNADSALKQIPRYHGLTR